MLADRILRLAACTLLIPAPAVLGYIRWTFTDTSGTTAYYRPDHAAIQFYVNDQIKPGQVSSASGGAITVVSPGSNPVQAIRSALAQWNSISPGNVRFLPLQSTSAVHDTTDFRAVITFASAADLSVVGSALAVTAEVAAVSSGKLPNGATVNRGDVIDSDILLNSSLPFSTDGSTPYDLQTVVTHEIGHSLGLNHNGVYGSTMFPYSTVNSTPVLSQRLLTGDDSSFLMAAYPQGSGPSTLSGRVLTHDGSPVQAALLTLVDVDAGNVLGAITDAGGSYSVQVPAASYIVYAEPLTSTGIIQPGNIYSLDPTHVTFNFQPAILGGAAKPTSVVVPPSETVAAPDLLVETAANSLSQPRIGFGGASGAGDITSVQSIAGPKVVPSGQSIDLGFVAGGFDGSESIYVLGQGVSVRAGSVRVDKSVVFPAGPLVRATLDIPARQTSTLASIFVTKPSGALALSGYLVLVPPTPTFVTAAVDSAASAQWLGGVSPGGITAIYDVPGNPNLGPTGAVVNGGYDAYNQLPVNLAGVSVTFDGVPAPLFFVYGGQVNLQVPFEVAGKSSTQVVITYNGSASLPVAVPVTDSQPAFFMLNATDPFAANADYGSNPRPNSAQNPAARGSVFSVYGTGLGKVIYDVPTGSGAPAPAAGYTGNYHCQLGSRDISVPFAGWTPTSVGLAQWSFVIPADSETGAVSLKCISIGSGASTQSATVYIR